MSVILLLVEKLQRKNNQNNKEWRSEKWNGVGAFTRIQIGSFCRSSSRLKQHLRSSDRLASSIAAATTHRKTGLEYDDYKGVLAFCGNNQQVVAKQGYECISSAVNTVARRVPSWPFCSDFSLKRCRFYSRERDRMNRAR